MMICKADFEELFPHLFTREAQPKIETTLVPTDACIARWYDDGGSIDTRPQQKIVHKTEKRLKREPLPCAMLPALVLAPFLAASAYWSLWAAPR